MSTIASVAEIKNPKTATPLFFLIGIGIDLLRRNVITGKVLAFSRKMASQPFNSLKFALSQILTNGYIIY